jgi:tRNA(adenine34) deaminase
MHFEKSQHSYAQQVADCARLSSGIFNSSAEQIADALSSPEVSPQGSSSGLRLITFYINYAGKRLSPSRRKNLEKAKRLLADRATRELVEREREQQHKVA